MSLDIVMSKVKELNAGMEQIQSVFQQRVAEAKAIAAYRNSSILKTLSTMPVINGTDKQIHNGFESHVEDKLETLLKPNGAVARSLKQIIADRKAKANMEEFSEASLESASIVHVGEVPSFSKAFVHSTEIENNRNALEKALKEGAKLPSGTESSVPHVPSVAIKTNESFSMSVVLNEKQLAAKEMAFAGKSFCLIGAAGTGKTTTQRAVAESLLLDDRLSISKFKTYKEDGQREYVTAPSIAFVAYTRRAAANLAKAILKSEVLAEKLKNNIMTVHSLLEYEPETYFDADEQKEKFRFSPVRTAANPLDITHLVVEESSMLGVADLWPKLYDALPSGVQIIFIGDINQLPPVFGPSILNYALVQLPIVELTQGYRNQGIVLENAWNILEGKTIVESPQYQIVRGNKPVQEGQIRMSEKLAFLFEHMHDSVDSEGNKEYDPEDCIILSPFNKQHLGTTNMNKWIAQFLGKKRDAVVHEIIAGFSKQYLAVGDKVMFNKVDGVIQDIQRNPKYFGREPQAAGADLSRFGHRIMGADSHHDPFEDKEGIDYSEFSLESLADEKIERKQQASHRVKILYADGRYDWVDSAGDLADTVFSLGYCLSVHKAQGSEWRKVFIIFHKDHSIMLFRELFYTAATRARTDVCIIAKDVIINKAIKNQRIKGSSLKDKLEFFNSGQLKYADIVCVK